MRELLFLAALLVGLPAIPAEEGYQGPSPEIRGAQWTSVARTAEAAERAIGQILRRHKPTPAAAIVVSALVDTGTALRRTLVVWRLAFSAGGATSGAETLRGVVCIATQSFVLLELLDAFL